VTVRNGCGHSLEKYVLLRKDTTSRQDLSFRTGSGAITCRVLLDGEVMPLSESRLESLAGEGGMFRITREDWNSKQKAHLEHLPAGRYLISVKWKTTDGRSDQVGRIVTIGPGEVLQINFSLRSDGASLSCMVPPGIQDEVRVMFCSPGQGRWKVGERFASGWTDACQPLESEFGFPEYFSHGFLPPGPADIVALRVTNGTVTAMERRPVTLVAGEVVWIEMLR
jgi:hypothetical protein